MSGKIPKKILSSRRNTNNGGGMKKAGLAPSVGILSTFSRIYSNRGRRTLTKKEKSILYELLQFIKLKSKSTLIASQKNLLTYFENYPYKNNVENFSYNNNTPYSIIYLKQSDFDRGTVRITKPGIYILKENITFHPNPTNDFQPTPQQIASGLYPMDPCHAYHLGFFAAITIETNNVILDLNNYTIAQSMEHYLQQRFYAHIELASAPFKPSQGPACVSTVANYKVAENTLIINGTLGRSSHHGIHGNTMGGSVVHNVTIQDFQVAGISLNGLRTGIFHKLVIKNTNGAVSTSTTPVPVVSTYSQARFIRPFLNTLKNKVSDASLNIHNGDKNITTIQSDLNKILDDTKKIVVDGSNGTIPNLFINPSARQLSDAHVYGILFNVNGVAIGDFLQQRPNDTSSNIVGNENIYLDDIEIKNIVSEPDEIIVLKDTSGNGSGNYNNNYIIRGPVGDVLDIERIVTSPNDLSGSYIPNELSNAQAIVGKYKLSNDISGGGAYFTQVVLDYIDNSSANLKDIVDQSSNLSFVYGKDSMAHTMKGNIGLFLSGGKNIKGDNIRVNGVHVIKGDPNQRTTPQITNNANSALAKFSYGILSVAPDSDNGVTLTNTTVQDISSGFGNSFIHDISGSISNNIK